MMLAVAPLDHNHHQRQDMPRYTLKVNDKTQTVTVDADTPCFTCCATISR